MTCRLTLALTCSVGLAQVQEPDSDAGPVAPLESQVTSDLVSPLGALVDTTPSELAVDRYEASILYDTYMENRDYPQALDAARMELELSEQEFGFSDPRLVPALNDMGEALLRVDQPAEAKQQFQRSAEIIRLEKGIFSPELRAPLVGMGRADQAMGAHQAAILNFQRAQHITHRNEGVYSLGQVDALAEIVESLMAQEMWDEAEQLRLTIFKLYRRNFGNGSLESLPALYELAEWYHDIQDYRQARLLYRKAIATIEDEKGTDAEELIKPLRGMAAAWGEERDVDFEKGLMAHQRIVQIVDSNAAVKPNNQVMAHLELGDWYVLFNREEEAWKEYRQGYEIAMQIDDPDQDWEAYFGRPHLIHPGATLSMDFLGLSRAGAEVYYDFKFTIGRDGRPDDIEIIGTNLHGQTRSAALQAFRYARFRPRILEGNAVETPGYKVRRIYPTPVAADYGYVGAGGRPGAGR